MYIAAGLLAGTQVPYTILFMRGTNNRLMTKELEVRSLGPGEKITEVGLMKGESAHELVDWWAMLNLGRSAFLVSGLVVATWTVVE